MPYYYDAAFTPDGRLLVTLVDEPRTDDVTLARVWDTATGRLVRTMTLPAFYADARVAVSPDGRFFIAANALGASSVWSVSDGKQVGRAIVEL